MQLCTAPQLSIDKLDHIFDWLPPLRIQRTTATNWLEGRHTLYITRTGPSMFVVATNTHQTWLDHIESLAAYREHHFARVFLKCVWCCISVAPEIHHKNLSGLPISLRWISDKQVIVKYTLTLPYMGDERGYMIIKLFWLCIFHTFIVYIFADD